MAQPDAAAKARVIAHMNKDHQHDLSAILQHQLCMSSSASQNPEMTDISLAYMTVRTPADGQTHAVPIVPPMATFAECRKNLVSMTLEARTALGLDENGRPVRVTRFLPPRGRAAAVFSAVAFYFFCYAAVRAGLVERGTPAWAALELARFPGGPAGFRWLVDAIFLPVLGVHVGECWWFERTRLAGKVDQGSRVWWAWVGCCFLEGLTTFHRFDAEVAALVGKRE